MQALNHFENIVLYMEIELSVLEIQFCSVHPLNLLLFILFYFLFNFHLKSDFLILKYLYLNHYFEKNLISF